MKWMLCLVILVVTGCRSPDEIALDKAQLRLKEEQAIAASQELLLKRCEARRQHSIRCAAECGISKKWHKDKWNK